MYTKQQFLQAHCQFVVKPPLGNEYVEQLADADSMVEWEQIEQVVRVINIISFRTKLCV